MATPAKMEIRSVDGDLTSMAHRNPERDSENRTAFINSRANYQRKRQTDSPPSGCCFSRSWVVLTVIFFTSTLALLGVLVWREFSRGRSTESKFDIRVRFPGYFRTKEEQAAFVKFVTEIEPVLIPVNQSVSPMNDVRITCCENSPFFQFSTTTTQPTPGVRRKRQAAVEDNTCCGPYSPRILARLKRAVTASKYYHGCCVSRRSFKSPNKLKNVHGVEKTLAQFPDMRQYFKQDNCKEATPCSGCKCMNVLDTVTAVIVKENVVNIEDKYDIDLFKMIGCCKCLNIGYSYIPLNLS